MALIVVGTQVGSPGLGKVTESHSGSHVPVWFSSFSIVPNSVRTESKTQLVLRSDSLQEVDRTWHSYPPYEEWFLIKGKLPRGYVLRGAVMVHRWLEGSEFVAAAPMLNLHAFGVTPAIALAHLAEEIVAWVIQLETLGDMVSPRLSQERELLARTVAQPNA